MGNEIGSLIDTVERSVNGKGSAADAEFAASLLASLMNQRDMAEAIMAGKGVPRLVALLGNSALSTASVASICTGLRCVSNTSMRVMTHGFAGVFVRVG